MAPNTLTKGERRVLRAYVEQETHEKAADVLQISTQTLKNHLGSIYKKLGVRKAHAAVYRLSLQQGVDPLVEPDEPVGGTTSASGVGISSATLTIEGGDGQNDADEAAI